MSSKWEKQQNAVKKLFSNRFENLDFSYLRATTLVASQTWPQVCVCILNVGILIEPILKDVAKMK